MPWLMPCLNELNNMRGHSVFSINILGSGRWARAKAERVCTQMTPFIGFHLNGILWDINKLQTSYKILTDIRSYTISSTWTRLVEQSQSVDFIVNRFFMELFRTSDMSVIKYCPEKFHSELYEHHAAKTFGKFWNRTLQCWGYRLC